jgi:endonuclease III
MNLSPCNAAPAQSRVFSVSGLINYALPTVDVLAYQTYRRPNHPDPSRRGTLIQVLAQIIISQRATLANEVRAADALFAILPSLEDLANAPKSQIADLIKPAGLHKGKAANIQAIARSINARYGDRFAHEMALLSDEDARAAVSMLPGVGPKTADCFLELGLGRLRLPIETNMRKLGIRLGLVKTAVDDDRLRRAYSSAVAQDTEHYIEAHSVLMAIGQSLCRADGPARAGCYVCGFIETGETGAMREGSGITT